MCAPAEAETVKKKLKGDLMFFRVLFTRLSGPGFPLRSSLLLLLSAVICMTSYSGAAAVDAGEGVVAPAPGDALVIGADSQVDASTYAQSDPVLCGNLVVWKDSRPVAGLQRFSRLFFKDLGGGEASGSLLTPDGPFSGRYKSQSNADAWGEGSDISTYLVVWENQVETASGGLSSQVYYTHPGEAEARPLSPGESEQRLPAVSGERVVWEDDRSGSSQTDVYMYDLGSGTETPVSTAAGKQMGPDIDGDWVVWVSNDEYVNGSPRVNDIFARNMVSGELRQVTSDGGQVFQESPAIDGNLVVFRQGYIGQPDMVGIFIYDLDRPEEEPWRITSDEGRNPDIDGGRVVWQSSTRGGTAVKLMLYDASTGEIVQVNQDSIMPDGSESNVYNPTISGDRVAWQDDRTKPRNIFHNRMARGQALAELYSPELVTQRDDLFQPGPVESMLEMPGTFLRSFGNDDFIPVANPVYSDLRTNQAAGLHIDLAGSTLATNSLCGIDRHSLYTGYLAPPYDKRHDYPRTTYARIVPHAEGTEYMVIQYWLFYLANDHNNLFHEGDWEMIEVVLDGGLEPLGAAYSQHHDGRWRDWDDIEGTDDDSHPVAYVAQGSHANYFKPGKKWLVFPVAWDNTDAAGERRLLEDILILPESADGTPGFEWLGYEGLWGERTDHTQACSFGQVELNGSSAPIHQADGKWTDPLSWALGLACDNCKAAHTQGELRIAVDANIDIHLYDDEGRHTGVDSSGSIEGQLPGSEYLEAVSAGEKIITVHGAYAPTGYQLRLAATAEGSFDMEVTVPDHQSGTLISYRYTEIPVISTTIGFVDLGSGAISLDDDADGVVDSISLPGAVEVLATDFLAPEPVTDLAFAGSSSGAIDLTFTAPRDNGGGSVSAYDLRYSRLPITADNWHQALPLPMPGPPQAAGSTEYISATGLESGADYYLALVAIDDTGQVSALSNLVSARTARPELQWSLSRAYWASWTDYTSRNLSVDYLMANSGTGTAYDAAVQSSQCAPGLVYAVSAMPVSAGDIAPGSGAALTIRYSVPIGIGNFRAYTQATSLDDAGRMTTYPERDDG